MFIQRPLLERTMLTRNYIRKRICSLTNFRVTVEHRVIQPLHQLPVLTSEISFAFRQPLRCSLGRSSKSDPDTVCSDSLGDSWPTFWRQFGCQPCCWIAAWSEESCLGRVQQCDLSCLRQPNMALFRDLQSIRLRQEVALLLNMDQPISGHDYRLLAELLGYEYAFIRAFGTTSNPTLRLLEDWETKRDATVKKLCDSLEEMERYDVLQLIQDHVKQAEPGKTLVVQETGRASSEPVTSHIGFAITKTDVGSSVTTSSSLDSVGSVSSVPSGSLTTVRTFICTVMRIPPDRGLLSAVSTSITNFQLLLAAILLVNDVMYGFGANIRGFYLSEHVMIFLPLWQFFYCEPRVKTNCELSRIITEKTLQAKDTCDGFEDEKLQKLKALRSRIAYSLRTAILGTLTIELLFITFVLARWHSEIRSDFFGAVFITFVSDTAFNCWLYFRHYHSIKTEKLDRRFVFYDLMMLVNFSNSSLSPSPL